MPRIATALWAFCLVFTAADIGASKGAEVARIPLKSRKLLEMLAERNIEILGMARDGTIDVLVDDEQRAFLSDSAVSFFLPAVPEAGLFAADLDANLGLYHTYAEMEEELTSLAATYPSLASLQSIGTSVEGRNIYALKISDNVAADESEPEVLLMGNLHSRELMTVEIVLKFAGHLLSNYGSDASVTSMVDEREIFLLPMLNPDGHVYVENNHGGPWQNWWRKNRRNNLDGSFGVDLNRNFGYQWGYDNVGSSPTTSSQTYRGPAAFSEPETAALRDFCSLREFTVGLSYHSYGELLLFPWGYTYAYTPDHDVFLTLGDSLASTNGYYVGNPAMGAIYLTNGDSDDWAYGDAATKPSFFLYTPEVNTYSQGGFGPPESLIQPTFDLLLPMNMTLLFLANNPYRVLGPETPALLSVDATGVTPPLYRLTWSGPNPGERNPPTGYEILEYRNLGTVPQDGANAASSLWVYGGFGVSSARSYEGSGSYYSGAVDNTTSTLRAATLYRVTPETSTFTAWLWYDIEAHYDYAYLEVSADGGLVWETVPGTATTTNNPFGNNRGHGITGFGELWTQASFSLSAHTGSDVLLRWSYETDASVLGEGIYIDLLGPVPTHEGRTTIVSSGPDTTFVVTPMSTGTFTYLVRARDAENDYSRWSNSEDWDVTSPTGVPEVPVIASTLGRNFPNPFNPMTTIPFTVAGEDGAPGSVDLSIYDATGARVATLVRRQMPPGAYEAHWRARDDRGRELPSGVYFARLTVGATTLSRKLVVLK